MAKKIITIGKKGVTERIEGNGPITDVNVDYPNGSNSSEAGEPFFQRSSKLPPNSIGNYSAAIPVSISSDGAITPNVVAAQGTCYAAVAFCPDIPSSIGLKWSYTDQLWVGSTLISDQQSSPVISARWFSLDAIIEDQSQFSSNNFTVLRSAIGPNFGRPGLYSNQNGLEFKGYPFEVVISDFNFTESDGGAKKEVWIHRFYCASQGGIHAPTYETNLSVMTVYVDSASLTQEMLDNPVFDGTFSGNPCRAYIAGVYDDITST